MRLPAALATALALAVLAGCVQAPGGDPVKTADIDLARPTPAALNLSTNTTVEVPVWSVGDAWSITSTNAGKTEQSTLVVTKATGDAYTLDSTSEQLATYDAMFDISYVGKIRAGDLAGHQQGQPVKFFDFPLQHAKSWTAKWDGQEISLNAVLKNDIATPSGVLPGFAIDGTDAQGKPYVHYDYVPALKWWSHIDFEAGYGFKVTQARSNWTGEYLGGIAKKLLTLAPAAPAAGTPVGTFNVDTVQTHVVALLAGSSPAHARAYTFVDPDHQPQGGPTAETAQGASGEFTTLTFPPKPGAWQVLDAEAHQPGGAYVVTVFEVQLASTKL